MARGKKPGDYLFSGRDSRNALTTRQYARLLSNWISAIGLDPTLYGTHSIRRTKATLIYRQTGNLRAVQLLLGHTKVESTVRYPTTSAARIAASLIWTRWSATSLSRMRVGSEILCGSKRRVYEGRYTALGRRRDCITEARFVRYGRVATNSTNLRISACGTKLKIRASRYSSA